MSVVEPGSVDAAPKPMTPLQEFWHYFKRNKGAVIGLVYVVLMIAIALFANVLAPHAPAEQFRDALLRRQPGRKAAAGNMSLAPMTLVVTCCRA